MSLFLAACGATDSADARFVEVTDAYLVAPSGGRDVAAGGLKITATGGGYTLVEVRSDIAEQVEMHTMSMQDGVMRMRQVPSFAVGPGETRELKGGGDHLMFFGLGDAEPGDTSELQLDFQDADGETITLNVPADVVSLDDL